MFQEPGEEPHDFCMSLHGVELHLAGKETKRELALKLTNEDKGVLYLEVSIGIGLIYCCFRVIVSPLFWLAYVN